MHRTSIFAVGADVLIRPPMTRDFRKHAGRRVVDPYGIHEGFWYAVGAGITRLQAHDMRPYDEVRKLKKYPEGRHTGPPVTDFSSGAVWRGRKKHSRPVGRLCRRELYLLQVEESLHAGVLGHVAQPPIVCQRTQWGPDYLKCSGEVNSPCAKVFACGKNACTAQSAAPSAMGPRGAGRQEKAQPPDGRLCCKTWKLTSG